MVSPAEVMKSFAGAEAESETSALPVCSDCQARPPVQRAAALSNAPAKARFALPASSDPLTNRATDNPPFWSDQGPVPVAVLKRPPSVHAIIRFPDHARHRLPDGMLHWAL